MIERIVKINGFQRDNSPIMEIGEEVVRCKDCEYIYRSEEAPPYPHDMVCTYWESDGLDEKDFCSRGKRMEQ